MLKETCRALLTLALAPIVPAAAQNLTEAEARMFSLGDAYELYMGRWSRLLAPAFVSFAAVKDGERVLDVGTGTVRSPRRSRRGRRRARSLASIRPPVSSRMHRSARIRRGCASRSATARR